MYEVNKFLIIKLKSKRKNKITKDIEKYNEIIFESIKLMVMNTGMQENCKKYLNTKNGKSYIRVIVFNVTINVF